MISASRIHKSFDGEEVLIGVSVSVQRRSIVTLIGPSGSGKTTLLNIIAGIVSCDRGEVELRDADRLGYMLQQPALLPWRTIGENAELGLEVMCPKERFRRAEVPTLLRALGLENADRKYPSECSIGMQQRAAFVRTLVMAPVALMLDEPFASLDYDMKLRVQRMLCAYVEDTGASVLLVTHDLEDAIALSDKIVVLGSNPTSVRAELAINLELDGRDPVAARRSPKFREYFEDLLQCVNYLPK